MFDVIRHIFIIPLQNQRNSKGEKYIRTGDGLVYQVSDILFALVDLYVQEGGVDPV